MNCTFRQYLAEHYDLVKIKDLNSLKTNKGVHGADWGDAAVAGEEEEEVKKNVDGEDNTHYNDSFLSNKHKKKKKKKHENPNKQGLIRKIKGAHLVYKRTNEDGTYDELWQYNIGRGHNDEYTLRSAILANTDIEPKSGISASGKQQYTLWTNNDVQMMLITNLPN